jgi:hypothetical protein
MGQSPVSWRDRSLTHFELAPRSGKYQHGIVIREAAVQDGLEDVVDHRFMVPNYRSDVDPLDRPARPDIQVSLVPEVIGQGYLQPERRAASSSENGHEALRYKGQLAPMPYRVCRPVDS